MHAFRGYQNIPKGDVSRSHFLQRAEPMAIRLKVCAVGLHLRIFESGAQTRGENWHVNVNFFFTALHANYALQRLEKGSNTGQNSTTNHEEFLLQNIMAL